MLAFTWGGNLTAVAREGETPFVEFLLLKT